MIQARGLYFTSYTVVINAPVLLASAFVAANYLHPKILFYSKEVA